MRFRNDEPFHIWLRVMSVALGGMIEALGQLFSCFSPRETLMHRTIVRDRGGKTVISRYE